MAVCDHGSDKCTCPFAFTDESEKVQNYGCLPTPREIIDMRIYHGKTWACHSDPTKPCVGAIRALQEAGLPHRVVDPVLVTDRDDWRPFRAPCIAIREGRKLKRPHSTPCIGVCSTTSVGDDVCRGCGRLFEEEGDWNMMSVQKKAEINKRIGYVVENQNG